MNFRPRDREEPELNLIPMIDVLIILLIFLVLTTTFSRESQLHIQLPETSGAGTASGAESPGKGLEVIIGSHGEYTLNQQALPDNQPETLKAAMKTAAGDNPDPLILIDADRNTTHQSVITVLDVAGQLGFKQVTFAAENQPVAAAVSPASGDVPSSVSPGNTATPLSVPVSGTDNPVMPAETTAPTTPVLAPPSPAPSPVNNPGTAPAVVPPGQPVPAPSSPLDGR